jgi:hypothetical protein
LASEASAIAVLLSEVLLAIEGIYFLAFLYGPNHLEAKAFTRSSQLDIVVAVVLLRISDAYRRRSVRWLTFTKRPGPMKIWKQFLVLFQRTLN